MNMNLMKTFLKQCDKMYKLHLNFFHQTITMVFIHLLLFADKETHNLYIYNTF